MASQKIHGITIGLDVDASGVSKSFSQINKDIRSTQQELRSVDRLLKLNPDNVVLLTQKQGLLTDAIDKTQDKLVQLAKAKELAEKDPNFDKNTKAYRELEQDIIKTRNALEDYNKQLDVNSDKLEGVYDETKKAEESTSRFGDVLKANITSDLIIGGVKALASAFKEVGDALVDVVKDSSAYADEVNTLSKNYNLSTKQIQQYMKASELIDVDVNTIAKSMAKLTKNMGSTSGGVVDAFKKLGIATKESDGSLRDSNVVFNEVIEALGKIENETEQDAVAMEIFGKSSAELGSLINGGAEQLQEFNKYLEENNLLLSQDELDALNEVQDGFDILNATTQSIRDRIGLELAPILQPIIEAINQFILDNKDKIIEIIQKIIDWVNAPETQEFFKEMKDLALEVFGLIGDITEVIEKTGALEVAFNAVKKVVEGILYLVQRIDDIITGEAWANGTLFSGGWNDLSEFDSGGFNGYQSLGFGKLQTSGFTSNLTINIANGNNITEQTVRGWAELINEELGQMA